MAVSLAIGLSFIIVCLAALFSVWVINNIEKKFLFLYMISGFFYLVAGAIVLLLIIEVIKETWAIPGAVLFLSMAALGSFFSGIAAEEKLIYRYQKMSQPIEPTEVEKGLNWKELEKWLNKNS